MLYMVIQHFRDEDAVPVGRVVDARRQCAPVGSGTADIVIVSRLPPGRTFS